MKKNSLHTYAITIRNGLFRVVCLVLTLCIASVLMCGCESSSSKSSEISKKQNTDDVIGKYDYGAWTISINYDASYQVYKTKTEELIKNGTWKYSTSESILTFAAFCDDGSDANFIRNKNNFILLDKKTSEPCYYNELSVTSKGLLDFTYSTGSLELKFNATGDIVVSGDNRAYGNGSYVIEEDKVYAYYQYTTPSAQNYANGEMYFYIYDKTHLIPYNCIMIKDSSGTGEPTYNTQEHETTDGTIYDIALGLIKEGKYEEAYIKLSNNKDDENCSKLLENFIILPTKRIYTDSETKITLEFEYNGEGQLSQEIETGGDKDENETALNEYLYHENGALANIKSQKIVNGTSVATSEERYDKHGNRLSGGRNYYYEYDDNGNVSYVEKRRDNGQISTSERYTYDQDKKLICKISYEHTPSSSNRPYKSDTYEYAYNEFGDVIECKHTTVSDAGEMLEKRIHTYKYEYSNNGMIVKKYTYLNKEFISTMEYSYNGFDQLSKIIFTSDDDNFTEEFLDYTFIYSNEKNNLFTQEYVFELMQNIR